MNIAVYLTIFILVISLLIKVEEKFSNLVNVISSINGKTYKVRKLEDKQKAADLLAQLHIKLQKVVDKLAEKFPDDKRVKRLVNRFPNTQLQESSGGGGNQTSYSINKGEKIVFCLRSKDEEKKLADLNLILFVGLHEISHIMTKSIGHTKEFWSNMKYLLEEASKIGIYTPVDYSKNPVMYCGMKIDNTPLNM